MLGKFWVHSNTVFFSFPLQLMFRHSSSLKLMLRLSDVGPEGGEDIKTCHGLRNMQFVFLVSGWFQKILKPSTSSPGQEQKGNVSSGDNVSASHTSSFCSSSSSAASGAAPSLHPQCALSSLLRGSRRYDVFVCHSSVEGDSEEAGRLVTFLEGSPHRLRCFLQHRDDCPGGATSTELCQAVQNSHLWALLITSNFLQDEWCQYMMNQALAEGPMSRRIIPLIQNLPRSLYPQELRFYSYIDLSRDPDRGYALLYKTVLTCKSKKKM